jgi:hypothetical protein
MLSTHKEKYMAYAILNTSDLRIEVRRDMYNWMVLIGSPTLKSFEKHAEYWYFSSLKSMLQRLFELLRDQSIKGFAFEEIKTALSEAQESITEIANTLEKCLANAPHKENTHGKSKTSTS